MKRIILIALVAALASTTLVAEVDIPLNNWTVPPYTSSRSSSGITPMTDITLNISFVGITVCRLLDTRPPVNNPLDGDGKFAANETRTYTIPPNCGIPTGTGAVSLNFTVTDTDSNPFGHLKTWPANQAEPNVSTLNWNTGGVTESNAAIVGLSGAGQLRVKTGEAGAHVLIDVNGYFTGVVNNYLTAVGTGSGIGIIFGQNSATATGSTGVRGQEIGASGAVYGVLGEVTSSTTAGAAGVRGFAYGDSGQVYGGRFSSDSSGTDSAGLLGESNLDDDGIVTVPAVRAGVRGEASGSSFGGLFFSENIGVGGYYVDAAGTILAQGWVAASFGSDAGGAAPWSFFGEIGDLGNIEPKSFVEPDPRDPSKIIQYISLEGPEAGTYFRGRGRFQNGTARITVPEDFRIVTDPEGLTVQITPIGAMATVGVMRLGLDEIVVQASRNVEFSYLVQGVRRAYKDRTSSRVANVFVPQSADSRLPEHLKPELRSRLIQNGSYKEDGTVNMETALRLGWDKIWEWRNPPIRTPAPE